MRIFIILCLLAATALSKPLNLSNIVIALDTGTGYSSNTRTADYNTNPHIASIWVKYASDSIIYKTERHSDESFTYLLPIPSPGSYVLITKYAEMWFKDSGKRMFNLKFGSCLVAEKIDVVAKVGKYAAYDEYTEFLMKDGQIYYNGNKCEDAVDNSHLVVTFEHIGIDNPMVNGIILYAGSLKDTDYEDIPKKREEWERMKELEKERKDEEALNKVEKRRRRNDELDDINADTEDAEYDLPRQSNLVDFLMTNSIFIFLAGAGVIFVAMRFFGSRGEDGTHSVKLKTF